MKHASGIGNRFAPGPLLTSIDELDQNGVLPETVVRLRGARVVYANYNALQHDFPQLTEKALQIEYPVLKTLQGAARKTAIEHIIDEWLIGNTAFISQRQVIQSNVNTPIATGYEQVTAYRPPGYGRAVVLSVEENRKGLILSNRRNKRVYENRLIDVKGIGVAPNREAIKDDHGTGLNALGFALFELVMQELLDRIFAHSDSAVRVLPMYAILDPGFDELDLSRNRYTPASLIARRAHRRPKDSGGLYPYGSKGQQVQVEIELLLRKYGITSANANTTVRIWKENGKLQIYYGGQHIDFFSEEQVAEIEQVSYYQEHMGTLYFEGINIQQTREVYLNPIRATLVDFQSYHVEQQFHNPLLCLVSDRLLRWGGSIWPHYNDFVSPDPRLQIPYDLMCGKGNIWGYNLGEAEPRVYSLCYGLAEDFRANRITGKMLLGTLQLYLEALTEHWNR